MTQFIHTAGDALHVPIAQEMSRRVDLSDQTMFSGDDKDENEDTREDVRDLTLAEAEQMEVFVESTG